MGWESWKLYVILFILITLLPSAIAQDLNPFSCLTNENYTTNSTYKTNLNTLLSSLSANMTNNGFYSGSLGQNPNRVNAVALCRADQTHEQCRRCVQIASGTLPTQCPNQKHAIIWYEFCTLQYSNEPINGSQAAQSGTGLRNTGSVPSVEEFRAARTRLLDFVLVQAANGGSGLKAGAGSTNASDSRTIYGLMQCIPDLSRDECDNCLTQALKKMRECCDSVPGVRILRPSCNLRFELYPFYNETRLRELRVPLSSVPPPPVAAPSPAGKNKDDSGSGKKDDNTAKVIIIIVVPIVVCIAIAACAVILMRKRIKRRLQEIPEDTNEISTVESLQYDFGKIRAATNDFADANKLGEGGFGAVYRGKLVNGQDIAVKRLAMDSGQGRVEFKNEVLLLAKLQHRNLVRLFGFALEGTERLLVYEFVQNASLDQFIFDPIKSSYLDWSRRYKIIAGIARGLVYLHEDSRLKIIHRDLKASNVLLDGDMNPKIADFGMARLFDHDETQGNTSKIVGTYGYMAPEYAMHGQFSIKSDVFSFGVLVLEIISGKRNNYTQSGENAEDLLISTWKEWQEGRGENVIDGVLLRNGEVSLREILRCIHMGLLCVQENADVRPTMTSIVLMLSSSTVTLPVPSEPAFYMATHFGPNTLVHQHAPKESNSDKTLNIKVGISEGSSQNEMSFTELGPR